MYLFDLTFKQRPYTFLIPKKCQSSTGRTVKYISTKVPHKGKSSTISLVVLMVSETFVVFQEMYRMERQPMASPMELSCQPAIFYFPEARRALGLSSHPAIDCFSNEIDSLKVWSCMHFTLYFLCSLCFSSTELPAYLEKIKQQANDAFARQQWTQAIQLYSLGIHQASCNAMLYGNRAAAYMKRKW